MSSLAELRKNFKQEQQLIANFFPLDVIVKYFESKDIKAISI